MAAQITSAVAAKLGKAAGDETLPALSADDIVTILLSLDLSGFDDLVPLLQAVLSVTATDGAKAAAHQLLEATIGVSLDQANPAAIAWAQERAAEMVGKRMLADGQLIDNPDAAWAITASTRDMLRSAVTDAVANGWSTQQLAMALSQDYAFSAQRATTIARTEIAKAHVAGSIATWQASGAVQGKEWLLGSEHDEADECDEAAALGVVPLDSDFGGLGDPPAHPQCSCDVAPVLGEE